MYIYIYIYRERERERFSGEGAFFFKPSTDQDEDEFASPRSKTRGCIQRIVSTLRVLPIYHYHVYAYTLSMDSTEFYLFCPTCQKYTFHRFYVFKTQDKTDTDTTEGRPEIKTRDRDRDTRRFTDSEATSQTETPGALVNLERGRHTRPSNSERKTVADTDGLFRNHDSESRRKPYAPLLHRTLLYSPEVHGLLPLGAPCGRHSH